MGRKDATMKIIVGEIRRNVVLEHESFMTSFFVAGQGTVDVLSTALQLNIWNLMCTGLCIILIFE